jgi:putative transposase
LRQRGLQEVVLMIEPKQPTEREIRIAGVLRLLGTGPMTREQARRVGQLLGIHWSTVYKLRRRFLQHPVASAVAPRPRGPKNGSKRIDSRVEAVMQEVLSDWLPCQRHLAHPLLDVFMGEVRRRCHGTKLQPQGRNTVARRWAAHRERQAAAVADDPAAAVAPSSFGAQAPLAIIQIDHN